MKIRHKRTGQFQRISSHRTRQLDHHKDQHQETARFSQKICEKIHNGHKSQGSQTGSKKGLSRLDRTEAVKDPESACHHCCLEQSYQIEYRSFTPPPGPSGLEFSGIFCQRIHKAESNAAYPESYRHHIGRHSMTVVFHFCDLGFLGNCRISKHIHPFFGQD